MPKPDKFDGVIVERTIQDGRVFASDKNGRSCWDSENPERVILTEDLRRYAPGLHPGQLGWTVPGTTDGYKWVDVKFDNGAQLAILTYGLERVTPEAAADIATVILAENRNTRFDADPIVAARCLGEFIGQEYAPYVDTDSVVKAGAGCQELYAFTFPSLRRLAAIDQTDYPVKIGYTADRDIGAIQRVRSFMFEPAAYPERPQLLLIYRTDDGRALELAVHRQLRPKRLATAVGKEWFLTTGETVLAICQATALR
ncbi:MAG: GIY-YIG nuclease family protein [Pirellulales bacterium]